MRNRHILPKSPTYHLKVRYNVWTVDQEAVDGMPQFDAEDIGLRYIVVAGCIQFVDTSANSIEI